MHHNMGNVRSNSSAASEPAIVVRSVVLIIVYPKSSLMRYLIVQQIVEGLAGQQFRSRTCTCQCTVEWCLEFRKTHVVVLQTQELRIP